MDLPQPVHIYNSFCAFTLSSGSASQRTLNELVCHTARLSRELTVALPPLQPRPTAVLLYIPVSHLESNLGHKPSQPSSTLELADHGSQGKNKSESAEGNPLRDAAHQHPQSQQAKKLLAEDPTKNQVVEVKHEAQPPPSGRKAPQHKNIAPA
eukprot:IDg5382t1